MKTQTKRENRLENRVPPELSDRLFVIDPSTKALGWAMFAHTPLIEDRTTRLGLVVASGCEKVRDSSKGDDPLDWVRRVDEMVMLVGARRMANGMGRYGVCRVLIELPDVYGSAKGQAASNTGAIIKLMGCVFALRQSFLVEENVEEVELVPVREWKGTVPKAITQKRIRVAWGWDGTDHNEADAVGIGDWWLRKQRGYSKYK